MVKWTAKFPKSGGYINVYKNATLVDTLQSGKDFRARNVRRTATELVEELAKQTDTLVQDAPTLKPDIADGVEVDGESSPTLPADANIASLRKANRTLKRKLAKAKKTATIERKARRGLAIAKTMVANGQIEDTEEKISEVMEDVVGMDTEEISRLENKVNNQPEFSSIEDAKTARRKYNRIASIMRKKAEEAEILGEDDEADEYDKKAEEAEMNSKACGESIKSMESEDFSAGEELEETEIEASDDSELSPSQEKNLPEELKDAIVDSNNKNADADVVDALNDNLSTGETPTAKGVQPGTDEEVNVASLARLSRVMAKKLRRAAEEALELGNDESAANLEEKAEEQESIAEELEIESMDDLDVSSTEELESSEVEDSEEDLLEDSLEEPAEELDAEENLEESEDLVAEEDVFEEEETEEIPVEASNKNVKKIAAVKGNPYSNDTTVSDLSGLWSVPNYAE